MSQIGALRVCLCVCDESKVGKPTPTFRFWFVLSKFAQRGTGENISFCDATIKNSTPKVFNHRWESFATKINSISIDLCVKQKIACFCRKKTENFITFEPKQGDVHRMKPETRKTIKWYYKLSKNTLIDSHWIVCRLKMLGNCARAQWMQISFVSHGNLWCTDAVETTTTTTTKKKTINHLSNAIEHGKRVGSLYKFTFQARSNDAADCNRTQSHQTSTATICWVCSLHMTLCCLFGYLILLMDTSRYGHSCTSAELAAS